MLDSLIATRFDRLMTKGRTGPFLLECEDGTQGSVEVVAKFTGPQLTVEGLIREALCAMLAADLGLPVPACYCVMVQPDFVAALATVEPDAAAFLAKAVPAGFGSAKLPPGFAAWMPGRSIPKGMQASAAEIYAFDLLVQNPDRRPDNPNLEFKGETFAIFDHEMALVTEGVLFWRPPWEPGSLAASGSPDRHILRPRLRGTAPDLARLIGAWEAIDDARLMAYGNAIPPQWTPNPQSVQTMETALGFLRDLRDHLRPAMQEITRTLA